MPTFKLGRRRPMRLATVPALSDFLTQASEWPAVPAQGWEYAVPASDLEMLGNDQWGDCAEAGAMHLIQSSTYNSGYRLRATLQQTLDLYTAVTGFDPNAGPSGSNSTDNGTVLTQLLQYWKTEGIKVTDPNGQVVTDKILGWASLDISSVAQYRYAAYTFGGTYLGINCPENYLQETDNWVYDPSSPIAGGHCINGPGEGSVGFHIQSWGMNIPGQWSALLSTLEEGYIVVRENWVSQQGQSPSGLDLNGLLDACKKI